LWIHSNQNEKIKNSEFFGTNIEKLANDSLSRFMKLPNKSSVKDGNNWVRNGGEPKKIDNLKIIF